MAKYTTLVRSICEAKGGFDEEMGASHVDTVIGVAWNDIFTTQCTFFDEAYRPVLCKKILKHYYMKEIGYETVGLWQMAMNRKLEEIMPYYNQLYRSELIEFNPMYNMDLEKTRSIEGSKIGSGSSSGGNSLSETVNDTKQTTGNESKSVASRNTEEIDTTGSETTKDTSVAEGSDSTTTARNVTVNEDINVIDTGAKRDAYSDTPQGTITNVEDNAYLTNFRKIMDNRSVVTDDDTVTDEDITSNGSSDYSSTDNGTKNTSGTKDSVLIGSENTIKNNTVNELESKTKTNTGTNNSQTSNSLATTEDYVEHTVGNNGSWNFSRLLQDFRDTFLNIDMMVINEFKGLFMGLW